MFSEVGGVVDSLCEEKTFDSFQLIITAVINIFKLIKI